MAKVNFDSPSKSKFKDKTKSFEIDSASMIPKAMRLLKKANIKVIVGLVVYLIVFGLIANIWFMFTETRIYFSIAGIIAFLILTYSFLIKLKNKTKI